MKKTLFCALMVLLLATAGYGAGLRFHAQPSRAQAVPPPGPGQITSSQVLVQFNSRFSRARIRLDVADGMNVVAAHFHCGLPGEPGPVAFGLFSPGPLEFDGQEASGTLHNNDLVGGATCVDVIGRPVTNIAALAFAMRDGLIYVNLHTTDSPAGEVRGQLLEITDP